MSSWRDTSPKMVDFLKNTRPVSLSSRC